MRNNGGLGRALLDKSKSQVLMPAPIVYFEASYVLVFYLKLQINP